MKNSTLFKLVLALILLSGLAFYVKKQESGSDGSPKFRKQNQTGESVSKTQKPRKLKMGDKVCQGLNVNEVFEMRIQDAENDLTLQRTEAAWVLPGRAGVSCDLNRVRRALLELADIAVVQAESFSQGSLERLQLVGEEEDVAQKNQAIASDELAASDTPTRLTGTTVSLLGKQGELLHKVILGKGRKREGMSQGRYLRVVHEGGKNEQFAQESYSAYLVAEDLSGLVANPREWMADDFLQTGDIKSMQLIHDEIDRSWNLSRGDVKGAFAFVKPQPSEVAAQSATNDIESTIQSLDFEDIVLEGEMPENTEKYKLLIETFAGFSYDIDIEEGNEFSSLRFSVSGDLPEQRVVKKEEDEKEKKMSDDLFAQNREKLQHQLAREKKLVDRRFRINKLQISNILRKRAEILQAEQTEAVPLDETAITSEAVELELQP